MSYIKQNFTSGQVLTADMLNHIEAGIIENETSLATGDYASKEFVRMKISEAFNENSTNAGQGLTQAQINALDALFQIVSYTALPTDAYKAFKMAFGIGVTPDEPDKTIYQSGSTLVINGGVTPVLDNTNLIIS